MMVDSEVMMDNISKKHWQNIIHDHGCMTNDEKTISIKEINKN
jgi:hypothetical protein